MRNMRVSDASEIITKASPYSVADTVSRFEAVITAKDMKVFAVINHSAEARHDGIELRDTDVVIFGNPTARHPSHELCPIVCTRTSTQSAHLGR